MRDSRGHPVQSLVILTLVENKADENVVRWSPRSPPTHQIMRPVETVEVMKPHRSNINRLVFQNLKIG